MNLSPPLSIVLVLYFCINKELKSFMARMALGQMGDADDVARVALFLASDLSSYITGDLIVVDGGYLVS